MRGALRNYLVLWFVAFILASLARRFLYGSGSGSFLMATTSLPTLDGGSVSFPSWTFIPFGQIWYYLILSIAGGISLAKILTVIARSAIAHNWKGAVLWLGGLLSLTLFAYFISLFAYRIGPWRELGLRVFYNTRGPFWPTLVFAAAIVAAKLLSNAAQSKTGKNRLFLILSGLSITSVLMMFAIPLTLNPYVRSASTLGITLIILDAFMYFALSLLMVFAVVRLVVISARRSRS